jgi:hypothetical protein
VLYGNNPTHPRTPRYTPLRADPHHCAATSPSDPSILISQHDEAKPRMDHTSCILWDAALAPAWLPGSATPSGRLNLLLPTSVHRLWIHGVWLSSVAAPRRRFVAGC